MNTVAVRDRLRECEIVIEEGKQTFVEVGIALAEIRDSKLYRERYKTFEQYCKQRWGWGRQRAYELIAGAKVVKSISDKCNEFITNPGQATALSNVPETERVEVLQDAAEKAESEGVKLTARHINQSRETWVQGDPVNVKIDPKADSESSVLFQLKRWWNKASKKDKKTFLAWVKTK